MSADSTGTITAALIGAVGGSGVATLIGILFKHRKERTSQRKNLVNRYFLQLQDATESLWFRLKNMQDRDRTAIERQLTPIYYLESTLYAFACFLAYKRTMLLDGIYS
jgi:hypothetical protein